MSAAAAAAPFAPCNVVSFDDKGPPHSSTMAIFPEDVVVAVEEVPAREVSEAVVLLAIKTAA